MQGKGRVLRPIRAPSKILFERIARMGPESPARPFTLLLPIQPSFQCPRRRSHFAFCIFHFAFFISRRPAVTQLRSASTRFGRCSGKNRNRSLRLPRQRRFHSRSKATLIAWIRLSPAPSDDLA